MDYKNTLNLPRTAFPMKADLAAREPARLASWETSGLYEKIQASRAGRDSFILHDGPPFANGDAHVGHVLNKVLKDVVIRYQTLRGKRAPYVPGWDCHGLPIEFKVTQELRKAGKSQAEPAEIRRACEEYAQKYIGIQRTQFKRLGVLGDWGNPYLTLNREYEADELRLFADLVDKGFVYRGKKPVYWSIPCRTALAEAEVEYHDHVSQSIFVKFPVVGAPGRFVVIWTTTPWTLPANLAVAYNSTFAYEEVAVGSEHYIVSSALLPFVAKQCGWNEFAKIRVWNAAELAQLQYQHPFIARQGKLFAGDSFVENSTGTGFVHIAPGHGLEDYGVGRQNGLPIYSPVDDDGRFALTADLPPEQQMPSALVGKSILEKQGRSEANEAVLELLRERKVLLHQESYSHSYPHCWRSKTPVIFRAMDQWFIRIDHDGFRARALETIRSVNWIPDWGRNRIEAAVAARPDWCISRQRAWGVPIPAFFDANGGAILDAGIVRAAADLVEKQGSNVWFETPVPALWESLKPKDWRGPEAISKSVDTLDVWIDSGSSSRAVLMRRPELQHSASDLKVGRTVPGEPPRGSKGGLDRLSGDASPYHPDWQADLYLEGSDQHRGWFQSSLLLSLAGSGAPPYRSVLTHGFIVNSDREKISKSQQSQGAYEKPQTSDSYVAKWGADIMRLWVASQDFRNDVVVSEERITKVSETYRVIRNTLRYQLSNLYDFDPASNRVPTAQLTGLDRWILAQFTELERRVAEAYAAFEFHVVYQRISQFAAVELSAIYHDIVKDRLYTDPANSARRRSTQTALFEIASALCKMLAPIIPFTAEEAWEFIPKTVASVHLAEWAPADFVSSAGEKETWRRLFELREAALPELEKKREAKEIGKALEASIVVEGTTESLKEAAAHSLDLRELLNVSSLKLRFVASPAGSEPHSHSQAVRFLVEKAEGIKCERCWHWETDVGSDPRHPSLCGRCAQAVEPLCPT